MDGWMCNGSCKTDVTSSLEGEVKLDAGALDVVSVSHGPDMEGEEVRRWVVGLIFDRHQHCGVTLLPRASGLRSMFQVTPRLRRGLSLNTFPCC